VTDAAANQGEDAPRRAATPVMLAVDDNAAVLRAVVADLRTRYSPTYRIMRADSGQSALEALRELKLRATPVALVLSDQRMPGMGGVDLLSENRSLHPESKAVLLTAYADTDVALQAINDVRLDYYILKPWDPPEERLYPVLDDLLEDWQAGFSPPFAGVRLVGHRWSREAHRLRDFLSRNQVPYQWIDVEADAEAHRLAEQTDGERLRLPLVVLAGGERLSSPSPADLARSIGLHTRTETRSWDLIIVGAGPAGLAAAVYGASEGLSTALLEREAPGGQAGQSSRIENYLGFPSGLSGADLARRGLDQARRFGAEVLSPVEVVGIETCDPFRVLRLSDGESLTANALIVATGVRYRRLDAPGADELTGAGVYYGAAQAEGPSCRDEDIAVVGGANSAGQAALYFAHFARKVTILVRAESLAKGMSRYLVDQIEATSNVEVRTCTEVAGVSGDGRLERVTVRNTEDGTDDALDVTSLFVFIGAAPHTDWLSGVVQRDERGFILTGPDVKGRVRVASGAERDRYLLETSVPGVFAVGDVRARSMKRVASAVGEGSIAVQFVHQYLSL
jgi:thioredoxin reductase (NADPH)